MQFGGGAGVCVCVCVKKCCRKVLLVVYVPNDGLHERNIVHAVLK